MAQKKVLPEDSPFLKTAAEAIGSTLGKLALKTGVVKPQGVTVPQRKKAAPKKRAVPAKSGAATKRAKKVPKKASR